jgi:hypothetical protein
MIDAHLFVKKIEQDLRDQLTLDGKIGENSYQLILNDLDYLRNKLVEDDKLNTPSIIPTNIIDQYGLASYLIQFYQAGQTLASISNSLSTLAGFAISIEDIDNWLTTYKETNSLYIKPNENKIGSIFDASSRYQDLYENLSTLLDDIKLANDNNFKGKSTTREQVLIELFREMRMLTTEADKFVSTQIRAQSMRTLIADIVNTIAAYNPIVARDLITIIKMKSSLWDSLLLGGISQPILHQVDKKTLKQHREELKDKEELY